MALINTLRNKMGKVVVAVIAIAILSFTLNDILGQNSILFGNDNSVGEIGGETIGIDEFRNVLEFQEQNFSVYAGRQPSEGDKYMINERAWLWLQAQYAFSPEYKNVGVEVGRDELWDMLQGTNIDPTIQSMFMDQATGAFNREQFLDFYQSIGNLNPNDLYVWNAIYPTIRPSRERLKYENLLVRSEFATQAEGKQGYHSQSDIAEVNYLFIPYYSVSAADVEDKLTDERLRNYFQENKRKYEGDVQRSLEYVTFPIVPSAQDTSDIVTEMDEMKAELTTSEDDEVYANSNSDGDSPYGVYHKGTVPYQLAGDLDNLTVGEVKGPIIEGSKYTIFKVTDIYDDTLSYARASHILFPWADETEEMKAEARIKALGVLSQLQAGGNFAALARQYGTDATANSGGDLGWFDSNTMVEEFEKPIFAATSTGLLPELIETQFGYHIVEITETKTNRVYAIASVERELIPSDETRNAAYRQADLFKSSSSDQASFATNAEAEGLEVLKAGNLNPMDRSIGTLGLRSRAIIQWLFSTADVGSVSDLYELDNVYVVAVMTDEIDEGVRPFSVVQEDVKAKVRLQAKDEFIRAKLEGLTGSLEEIAAAYGEDANVYQSNDLKLETSSLANVGFDPVAVGRIFSLNSGENSGIFSTDNGVFIAEMINLTKAPDVADYSSFSTALQATRSNTASIKISSVLTEAAEIEDRRYKVY